MEEGIENKINVIGAKIEIIESINNALIYTLCGIDNLQQKDAYNFVSLLEEKIADLKSKQNKLTEELNI